jgi:hypothetical protein
MHAVFVECTRRPTDSAAPTRKDAPHGQACQAENEESRLRFEGEGIGENVHDRLACGLNRCESCGSTRDEVGGEVRRPNIRRNQVRWCGENIAQSGGHAFAR